MSTIMIVIDGIENDEYACCASLKDKKVSAMINNTPQGMEADSLNCIMTLLGVAPQSIPSGRAHLEACAVGIGVGESDLVFRCNLIELDAQGVLSSSCKMGKAVNLNNPQFILKHIGKHKYLLIIKQKRHCFDAIKTFPPHQHIGKKIGEIMPIAPKEINDILVALIEQHGVFPWGQAVKQVPPTFWQLHKKSGAVVAKTEIVVGMAHVLGMACPPLKHATADVDTDLTEKTTLALRLAEQVDFVMLHINGADESAHRRDKNEKLTFIQQIDEKVIRPILQNAMPHTGVIITADHETSATTGRHVNSAVNTYTMNNLEGCYKWLKRS